MARTMVVARSGQQRSFVRIFQVLSVAMPRSTRARLRACEALTRSWLADSDFGRRRNGIAIVGPAAR